MLKMTLPVLIGVLMIAGLASSAAQSSDVVTVIDNALMQWNKGIPERTEPDGYVLRHEGQTIERTVDLPSAPIDQRDAKRIMLVVRVEPVLGGTASDARPNDRWTRMGRVAVVTQREGTPVEVELMRFMTGYGAAGVFEQDVTAFAPLLHDRTVIRAFLNTYSEAPGWRLSVSLRYLDDGVGQRRPTFTAGILDSEHVTADRDRVEGRVMIPESVDRPRLRVISTGHSTDGLGGNEFESATHVLSVDGRTVAMWRPWSEAGGDLRASNPWAGRRTVDGRTLWASDYDRTGWHPNTAVEAVIIPLPELTPGPHTIQIRIRGIRAKGELPETEPEDHGYWVVSGVVIADEPWPGAEQPKN